MTSAADRVAHRHGWIDEQIRRGLFALATCRAAREARRVRAKGATGFATEPVRA
jgi:hypothetical protein